MQTWIDGMKEDFPDMPVYLITHLARAYQLNPEKFDNIIENNVHLESDVKYDEGGVVEGIKCYKNLEEFQKDNEKDQEKKSN